MYRGRHLRSISLAFAFCACKAQERPSPEPPAAPAASARETLSPPSENVPPPVAATTPTVSPLPTARTGPGLPPEMLCMTEHYPAAAAEGAPGALALVVRAWGERVAYEVRPPYRARNPLRDFVVKDFFDPPYPRGPIAPVTTENFDPGRVRLESLFRATYGGGRNEVESKLVSVSLGGHLVRVHERIREPMRRVDARVQELFKTDGQLRKYFDHMGGTYNYRNIAGTEQLSTHAFGIAIDLSTYFSHYWRNAPEVTPQWKNSIPESLVLAFEAEGFIWGGRWYHYDTMHFEYRPELLDERCRGR